VRGIDWFAGVGGYTLAMRRAGIAVVGACERDVAKHVRYVEACGIPRWFGEDCVRWDPPPAEIWTACAAVRDLQAWLTRRLLPRWVVCETVVSDWDGLHGLVVPDRSSWSRAGKRGFVVYGPRVLDLPPLPEHDGQGPESDPHTLDIVLRAIVEADA